MISSLLYTHKDDAALPGAAPFFFCFFVLGFIVMLGFLHRRFRLRAE
jgi:hypothetical protein